MAQLFIIIICLFLNGILAAIEMAFVSVTRSELKKLSRENNVMATLMLKLREKPERTLSVLQIGITLVGAISAAVGGAGAEESLAPYLEARFAISERTAEILAITAVVIPLTYFSVVLGELVPKAFALRNATKISLLSARWVQAADAILGPLVTMLERSTLVFMKLILRKPLSSVHLREEENIDVSKLSQPHKQYVLNLVNIENKKVKDIMWPWSEVIFITTSQSTKEVLDIILSTGHTRLPVLENNQIAGILHAKEFLSYVATGNEGWQPIIRPSIKVSPYSDLLGVLKTMQESKRHMSIVLEQNKPIGIVTIEDIIEEIVGDINDEDDDGQIRRIILQRVQNKLGKSRS